MMKKRTIWVIISIMSLALVGLVAFQLYWINSAIRLNNERFHRDVSESLRYVTDRLERQEALFFTAKSVEKIAGLDENEFIHDAPNRIRDLMKSSRMVDGYDSTHITSSSSRLWYFSNDSVETLHIDGQTKVRVQVPPKEQAEIELTADTVVGTDNLKLKVGKLSNKSEMVTIVLEEILSGPKKIKKRIHPATLDSLLKESLTEKGIHIEYEFGVVDSRNNSMIISNTEQHEDLRKSDLKASLFPNDIIDNAHYLMVNFPDEGQFLFRQIWATLASSLVLLIIILGCFTYAILIILRQKKVSEIKTDFINNMTHEFKTPIATVSLACQALNEDEVVNNRDTYQRYLQIIKDENRRLGQQVERVLQVATLERRDIKLKFESLDVKEIVEKAVTSIKLQIEAKEGDVAVSCENKGVLVSGDPVHLSNIIYNLLDNASKYSTKPPKITVSVKVVGSMVSIAVADKGRGMSNDQQKRIFEKFYRVPTGNLHDVKGFGLGLTYVKSIVDAHGGQILVESELGRGTTFTIELPLADG